MRQRKLPFSSFELGSSKAQITIFIIMGIMILIAFAFVYQGAKTFTKKQYTTPVQDHVTSCLKATLNEALWIIGAQGTIQQGRFQILVDSTPANATALVTAPHGSLPLFTEQPPDYPFLNFPMYESRQLFTGYYGVDKLLPLTAYQAMIEQYIAENIQHCVSWNEFPQYDITTDTPRVHVLFGQPFNDASVTAELNWTISVSDEKTTTLDTFIAQTPVRFATIHATAKQIIANDATNITYVPQSTDVQVSVVPYDTHNTVILTDMESALNDRPYSFHLTRENRRPALWHITETITAHESVNGKGTTISYANNKLTFNDPCDDDTVISVNATDPDEDILTITTEPSELTMETKQLKVIAKDGELEDYQMIPVQVALCVKQ